MCDSALKLDKQINAVAKISFFQLRLISKIKPFLSRKDLEKVIHAFIFSRLDYCNSLYYGVQDKSLGRLQVIQNAAARLLTGTRKYEHITPILRALHWLPVSYRIIFKILSFVFKALHGRAPPYIVDLIQTKKSKRTLRSKSLSLLEVPRTYRKMRGDRSFAAAAPRLWNGLPLYIQQCSTLGEFKQHLKTYLFTVAFELT